ncbi:arsenate reductase/protein-tyrosine-phosphatase family protein [Roseovarius salinarum]|uniref:arsenate reductase/protein-tyrosine-phosphatase family protein n=1 Tax=Roseovarius salinarum TaxID=1981892 RepID=UPI000C34DB4E|nr:helix-turn-helix domain-containing protein [Roseovarius salinarum]
MERESLTQLATLAHPQRMAVFRLLMRRYPDEVAAGEIGRALVLKPSTTSVYLSALTEAGLIAQRRVGTSLRYRIEMPAVRDLLRFLAADCCRARPDLCPPLDLSTLAGDPEMPDRRYNVLFICVGNSARSIFAESLLRDMAGDRFVVHSAGTRPYSQLNPFALEVLEQKGHDTAPLRAKTVAEFQGPDAPAMDFVFTVCDRAANEECPPWPGQPITAHWGVPDPVKATGSDAEKSLAFQQAYGMLKNRMRAFAALPLGTLDRVALQAAVDDIATHDGEVQS